MKQSSFNYDLGVYLLKFVAHILVFDATERNIVGRRIKRTFSMAPSSVQNHL